jgi:hypothetical protein
VGAIPTSYSGVNKSSFRAMAVRNVSTESLDTRLLTAYSKNQKGGKRPPPFNKSTLHTRGQRFKSSTAHHEARRSGLDLNRLHVFDNPTWFEVIIL